MEVGLRREELRSVLWRSFKEEEHMGDISIDGRIILKRTIKKCNGGMKFICVV